MAPRRVPLISRIPPARRRSLALWGLLAWSIALGGETSGAVAAAQPPYWSAGLRVGLGLPAAVTALGERVSGTAALATVELRRDWHWGERWRAAASAGVLYARRSGEIAGSGFTAEVWRVVVAPRLGRRLAPRLTAFAGAELRNAKDVADFDIRTENNLRADLRLDVDLAVGPRVGAVATFTQHFGESDRARYVVDPRQQARLGLRYRFDTSRS